MGFEFLSLHIESVLDREFGLKNKQIHWLGSSSASALSMLLAQSNSKNINNLPHVVIVSSSSEAMLFEQAIQFFDSQRQVYLAEGFDVSPYLGLSPRYQNTTQRLGFLFRAQQAKAGDIFVVPIQALLQKTLPYADFVKKIKKITPQQTLDFEPHEWLSSLGYSSAPFVEDVGQYSIRGGIIDIFSPAHTQPCRIELFGDDVESLRFFSTSDQRSTDPVKEFYIVPARECLYDEQNLESVVAGFINSCKERPVDKLEYEETLRSLTRSQYFANIDFLLPLFYKKLDSLSDYFSTPVTLWNLSPLDISRESDLYIEELSADYKSSDSTCIRPNLEDLFFTQQKPSWPEDTRYVHISGVDTEDFLDEAEHKKITYNINSVIELKNQLNAQVAGSPAWLQAFKQKLDQWKQSSYQIFISAKSHSQAERLKLLLDKVGYQSATIPSQADTTWTTWIEEQRRNPSQINILVRRLGESFRSPEDHLIFLRDDDLLGKKTGAKKAPTAAESFQQKARLLNFGDLKPGDMVVHVQHGIGQYEGLKIMNIGGVDSEFIQLAYKDKDKLYLPVYRIAQLQKYSGAAAVNHLDKLGGTGWEKTKAKVKNHLRDLANDLLQLYAKRAEISRPAFNINQDALLTFESRFPYDETEDQERAIGDILKDFTSIRPMDRLICGDVGFGKTEIAMRAAYVAAQTGKQVALLAPTTVLTFQHYETLKKRFNGTDLQIRCLNRFISNAEAKKTVRELSEGSVHILVGTHRILSKDVQFRDLGLLIIDEEQKFGVAHKEKIRKLRTSVDTLAMSATPIPRTLNMSLMGVRDLSLINTAPVDRLPTRTFITKFEPELIKKAITSEITRGGQIYFIHNRVQSIYGLADELRQIVPEARIQVAHGQMEEHELEQNMLKFFNHEIDILVCTAIVESGMDVPKANTMFIDQPQLMGLSQLYQLRGRVGRSKQRAFCYLLLPRGRQLDKDAQERLKVIQENSDLGSGISIAQYDLELRGAGNILGEEQSGHVNSVGYELYMDLLNEAVHELRGDPLDDYNLEPEINLKIPALIPQDYIPDIRMRLSYYKALADIKDESDLERLELEMKDQFGDIPEPALNLMGLMLIRAQCKILGVRDVSAGLKNVSLVFTEKTKLKPETAIQLAMRENKKYSITPDNRLNIRMNQMTWPNVLEELTYLIRLAGA